jgi:hypothetical protein
MTGAIFAQIKHLMQVVIALEMLLTFNLPTGGFYHHLLSQK